MDLVTKLAIQLSSDSRQSLPRHCGVWQRTDQPRRHGAETGPSGSSSDREALREKAGKCGT